MIKQRDYLPWPALKPQHGLNKKQAQEYRNLVLTLALEAHCDTRINHKYLVAYCDGALDALSVFLEMTNMEKK